MKHVFLIAIRLYRTHITPFTPATCRYTPTCSKYAEQALEKYGVWKGGWLTLRRLLRCHPFSHHDLYDPVP